MRTIVVLSLIAAISAATSACWWGPRRDGDHRREEVRHEDFHHDEGYERH